MKEAADSVAVQTDRQTNEILRKQLVDYILDAILVFEE